MRKEELRQQMRQIKRQFTPQQLEELSLPIVARLKERLKDAQTVVAYYSLPDEVNTHDLIDDLLAEGKIVLLPKVIDDKTMELQRYNGRQNLKEGVLHLLEPDGEPFTDYSQIDIILVPGMAFDAAGHRLGRGRGYYDRFLNTVGTILLCQDSLTQKSRPSVFGVCFDFQKVAEIPTDEYDISIDEVI